MSGALHGRIGSPDSRPRYDVLQPVLLRDGSFRWLRVGVGYANPDGTIDAYLDVFIPGHRFRLRVSKPAGASKDEPAPPPEQAP